MNKLKVMSIFGTRPDAVKMAPLVKELEKYQESIESIVCVTAQHREMLDQVLKRFEITPDYDLNIMQERQTLEQITVRAVEGLSSIFKKNKPDIVLVHGDTSTTFAGSLAAFYNKVAVGHVEAGLRTYDKYFPYPEEMNRRLTGVLTDLHFAPTKSNRDNLLKEGINPEKIYVTGNTVIDALKTTVSQDYSFINADLNKIEFKNKRIITVEVHRRENLGKPLNDICEAIREVAEKYHDVEVIYPVHLNPAVRETAYKILGGVERVTLTEPIDVQDMHNLLARSYMVITDSGGLQEESPSLGTPVLVARNETERPEAVVAGTVKLAGTNKETIVSLASLLLDNSSEYEKMAKTVNPYGDGNASDRIVKALLYEFGYSTEKPAEFNV